MLQFISNSLVYAMLMIASPAVNAMRTVESRPAIVVFESESSSQHRRRRRHLDRRFGTTAPRSFVRFAS